MPAYINTEIPVAVSEPVAIESVTVDGTFTYLNAGGEQTIYEITPTQCIMIESFFLDLTTLTKDGYIKIYSKIDGTNYRLMYDSDYQVGVDAVGEVGFGYLAIDSDMKITWTEDADEGSDRAIPYKLIYSVFG